LFAQRDCRATRMASRMFMNRGSGFRDPASRLPDRENLGHCKFISLGPGGGSHACEVLGKAGEAGKRNLHRIIDG